MTSDRLTRTELTWLLAQEARSAAQKLRQGVGTSGGAAQSEPPPTGALDEASGGVESTLNRLDEAVSMLAHLHGHAAPRGRRGKVDLAALLWEVAPEARVQIEMGEGTSVFGDESELRRMLLVLVGQAGDPTSARGTAEVTVRRQNDEVRVAVSLGPDKPATFETECAWLSRMAVRYGGRLELDGSMHALVLPADVDTHRREVESLRRELAAAQAQGEAYARELAAVRCDVPATSGGVALHAHGDEALGLLVAASRSLVTEIRGILAAIGRDIAPLRDGKTEAAEIARSVGRHVTAASEVVSDLAQIGSCPVGEPSRPADLADLLRDVVTSSAVRAARHDVRVAVEAAERVEEHVPIATLTALLRALLDHAIGASPAGSEVRVTLADAGPSGATFTFDDCGPPLSAQARAALVDLDYEGLAAARPNALPLVAACAIAGHLRMPLEIADGARGGASIRVLVLTAPAPASSRPKGAS